jgi:hypothetical protein
MNVADSSHSGQDDSDLTKSRQFLIERLVESRRQLDEGEYVEFDQEGLRKFFDKLIDRAYRGRN